MLDVKGVSSQIGWCGFSVVRLTVPVLDLSSARLYSRVRESLTVTRDGIEVPGCPSSPDITVDGVSVGRVFVGDRVTECRPMSFDSSAVT